MLRRSPRRGSSIGGSTSCQCLWTTAAYALHAFQPHTAPLMNFNPTRKHLYHSAMHLRCKNKKKERADQPAHPMIGHVKARPPTAK